MAVFVVNRPQLLFGSLGDHFIQLEHDWEKILATVARVVDKRLVLVSEFERFAKKVCAYPGFVKMEERPQEGGRGHFRSRLARELVLHQSELENVSRQGQLKKMTISELPVLVYLFHVEANDLAVSSKAEVGNGQVDVELKHGHELDFELEDLLTRVSFVANEHQVIYVWRHSVLQDILKIFKF